MTTTIRPEILQPSAAELMVPDMPLTPEDVARIIFQSFRFSRGDALAQEELIVYVVGNQSEEMCIRDRL